MPYWAVLCLSRKKVLLKKKEMPSVLPKKGENEQRQYQVRDKDRNETGQRKSKGVSCSCGQLCKYFRGLKLHQIKAKCQASENKLIGPDKRCFVSLTDILNTSFLKFGDTIYWKTPSNTFFQFVTLINPFLQPSASWKPVIPRDPADPVHIFISD